MSEKRIIFPFLRAQELHNFQIVRYEPRKIVANVEGEHSRLAISLRLQDVG